MRSVGRGRRLDLAFGTTAKRVAPRARARLQELVYGTVRLRGRIDHLLDLHLDRGVDSVPPPLLDVLRLGAYQILYMDSVPTYAAVSESVELAKEVGGRKGGSLVNAVLRTLARAGADGAAFPEFEVDPAGYLTTWGSHPRWLVERWLERSRPEDVRRLVEANNRIPALYLRPLRIAPGEAVARLSEAGVRATEVPGTGGCLRVEGRHGDPRGLVGLVEGIAQDPAAALVTVYAGITPGTVVADLCAAPGGKAFALAASGARVLAADRSLRRLELVREGAERLELRLGIVAALAEAPPLRSAGAVLVDAPCSGTGTLARHPDARWRLRPADIEALARVQDRILDGSAGTVPPRGLLVYSTCTMEPEENEERVAAFLERHEDFALEAGDAVDSGRLDETGFLRVLPHETEFDGAFAARLRRVR